MRTNRIQAGFAALSIVVLLMSACGGGGEGVTGTTTVLSAYVANYGDGTISQYTINPSTGALTPKSPPTVVSDSALPASSGPTSIAVAVYSGYAKYAYIANSLAGISQFTIGRGGVLQAMNPASVLSGGGGLSPTSVAVDPSGKYLYAVNSSGDEIAQFTIGMSGALTPMSPNPTVSYGTGSGTYASIAVDPTGQFVYVADWSNNLIAQFTIGAGGALQTMTAVSTGPNSYPISIGFDPAGKYAYVVNYGNAGSSVKSTVTQYSIATSGTPGALASVSTATPTQLDNATSIAIDKAGAYAYVACGYGLYQLPIYSDGSLIISVAPILTGGTTPQSVAIDPSGKFVYVTNQIGNNGISATGSVSQFNVGTGFVYAKDVSAGNQAYFITTAVSIQ
ncbi:MAG: beta-propeller fold lactonase family protein [Gallionella sp.]